MKKLSLIVICAFTALLFASCQSAKKEDKNGRTPSMVVDEMYKAMKDNRYDVAADFTKIPDTIKMKEEVAYPDFMGNEKKDGKIIIAGDVWKKFVISQMQNQSESARFELESWEIVSEEISNTDPNSAKVKTRIHITTNDGKSDADCSFPMKRENGVWLIIG